MTYLGKSCLLQTRWILNSTCSGRSTWTYEQVAHGLLTFHAVLGTVDKGLNAQEPLQSLVTILRQQLAILQGVPGALAPLQARLAGLSPAFLPPGLSLPISTANQIPLRRTIPQQGPLDVLGNAIGLSDATVPPPQPTTMPLLPPRLDAGNIPGPTEVLEDGLDALADAFPAAGPFVDRLLDGPDFP